MEIQESEADPLEATEAPFNSALCDEKLALMLVNFSFNMIEGEGFIHFMRTLQPKYVIQSRMYYENLLCHHIYPKFKAQLNIKLEQLDAYTMILGHHRDNESGLVTLNCSGISSDFQFLKFLLKCKVFEHGDRHGDDIMKQLVDNNWWPLSQKKIHCILRDESTTLGDSLTDCNVERLKLCIQSAFDSNETFQQLARKCKEIVKHFECHQMAKDHLNYIQVNRLKREYQPIFETNNTEWNSIYTQMAELYKMKDSLSIYAEEFNSFIQIYPDEWLEMDKFSKVVQPFLEIIKIWSEDTTLASSVIPLVAALRDSLQTDMHNFASSVTISALARKLVDELNIKFAHLSTDMKYLMATYLDPRYKQAFFTEQQEQIVVNEVLKELDQHSNKLCSATQNSPIKVPKLDITNKNKSKIDSILDNILTSSTSANNQEVNSTVQSQLKNLLYLYNSEPRIDRNGNPLIWWQNNIKFSPLYELVRRYLSTPASINVDCDKLFKSSAHIYGDLETGLCTKNASKIIFIKSNLNTLYSDGD
ncbi:zinc finger BED domain-containing protein 4 [Drosophila tropicalis]|uniref:zinc finger BED domain-containing protein 4 n=1 Tax=Drosophila tropicalis TaxID=46794 RepID=UPI0035AB732B